MIEHVSVGCQIVANYQVGASLDHISFIIKDIYTIEKSEK